MASRDVESIIHCGYARVSIRTLTRSTCDKSDERLSRTRAFRKQFAVVPKYWPEQSYFQDREGRDSPFDRNCRKIQHRFCQKWHPCVKSGICWESLWIHGNVLNRKLETTPSPPEEDTHHVQLSGLLATALRSPEPFSWLQAWWECPLHNKSKLYNST